MGDQNQAANNALAAISANLHPGNWDKSEDADENLQSFNVWLEKYRRWTNVCIRGINMDDSMKWDMLVATAGNDLHDIMKEAGIITERRNARNEQQHRPFQARVPAVPGPNPGDDNLHEEVPEQPEVPYLPAVTASVPTEWDTGIQLIRNTIKKYGNAISQRHTLMTAMPASNYDSWRVWGLRLKEQSKRCGWGAAYTWEVAALDALLYQCPDEAWKAKILRTPQWTFQEALDYGIQTATSKKQSQALSGGLKNDKREELPVDRVDDKAAPYVYDCKKCMQKHGIAACPAYNKNCSKCGTRGHTPNSAACNNPNGPPSQRGGGQQRGGGRNQKQGGGNYQGQRQNKSNQNQSQGNAGPPQSSTKTVFRREGNQWVKKKQTVNYVEEDVPPEEDSAEEYEYDCDRVLDVRHIGPSQAPTIVRITPVEDAEYRTKVPWTTDSGVRKTLHTCFNC